MTSDDEADAHLLLAAADATWRCEAAKVLGRKTDDPVLADLPEAYGEPGTVLRTAYELRERARAKWLRIRQAAA